MVDSLCAADVLKGRDSGGVLLPFQQLRMHRMTVLALSQKLDSNKRDEELQVILEGGR